MKDKINFAAVGTERKKTGELCFQFDDDEPYVIHPVYDNAPCTLTIQQIVKDGIEDKDGKLVLAPDEYVISTLNFYQNGKKFKIFIRSI